MIRILSLALAVALGALSVPTADAQTLMDALRARRERQQQAQRDAGAPSADGLDAEAPTEKFALPPDARVERDVAYGSDPAQKLDVYLPKRTSDAAPVIVMVHGGAWMLGDKGHSGVVANKVGYWLPKGYVLVSVNYRMARPPDPLEQADDVARAIAFVQAQSARWGADRNRMILMGHSSGAHLAALLASDPGIAAHLGAQAWLGSVLLDSAAMNVVETMQGRHARFYDRVFGADPAQWARMSPWHRLAGHPAPMLLVCSTKRTDSCPAARAFAEKATSLGARAELAPVDLNHGQINSELGRPGPYTATVDRFLQSLGLP